MYGNIFKRKKRLLAHLEGIDRKLLEGPSERLSHLKRDLWGQYNAILDQEEVYWFQQSRSKWLRLGDRNTKYFHQTTLIRKRSNRTDALRRQMMIGAMMRMRLGICLLTSIIPSSSLRIFIVRDFKPHHPILKSMWLT